MSQPPIEVHPDFSKRRESVRHQPFTARLVDRRPASVDGDDIKTATTCGKRCREACGPAADDDEIGFGG